MSKSEIRITIASSDSITDERLFSLVCDYERIVEDEYGKEFDIFINCDFISGTENVFEVDGSSSGNLPKKLREMFDGLHACS